MAPLATAALSYLKKTAVRRAVTSNSRDPRRRRRRTALYTVGALALLSPFVVLAVIASLVLALVAPISSEDAAADVDCSYLETAGVAGASSAAAEQFDDEQLGNAETIITTAQELNVPHYGQVIAIATAIQESTLVNVNHGDAAGPDSRGLFQQRASWGPESVRMDPAGATAYFFHGGEGGQRGLLDVPDWQDLPVGVAAQAVQVSADSSGAWYQQHEGTARGLVSELGAASGAPQDCGPEPAMDCPSTPYTGVESELMPDAQLALRCLHQQFSEIAEYHGVGDRPSGGDGDHAAGRALDAMIPEYDTDDGNQFGWRVAEWLQDNHAQLGIKYLIFDDQIWSVQRNDEGWRPYEHFADCDSDTCRHLDHVHVSVYGNAAQSDSAGEWVLPVPDGSYNLTARFGACGGPWASCHTGLDFAASSGTPIHASSGGTVTHVGNAGAYGNLVRIDHGNGVVTAYAHMSSFAAGLQEGSRVDAGTVIGYVGSTGNSSGPHLHFEVRNGSDFEDPEEWLRDHGVDP